VAATWSEKCDIFQSQAVNAPRKRDGDEVYVARQWYCTLRRMWPVYVGGPAAVTVADAMCGRSERASEYLLVHGAPVCK
jgi:hypothetical protein